MNNDVFTERVRNKPTKKIHACYPPSWLKQLACSQDKPEQAPHKA